VLPTEDVKFYAASDDEVITGSGIGKLNSLGEAIHRAAKELVQPA
jgi:hypothetical protein